MRQRGVENAFCVGRIALIQRAETAQQLYLFQPIRAVPGHLVENLLRPGRLLGSGSRCRRQICVRRRIILDDLLRRFVLRGLRLGGR